MILNHSTIAQRLTEVVAICKQTTLTAGETLFFANFNNKWSIAENLIHLIISVKGMNKAMQFVVRHKVMYYYTDIKLKPP